MAVLILRIVNKDGKTICEDRNEGAVSIVYTEQYQEGDRIVLECSDKNIHVMLQLDDAMGSAFTYLTDTLSYVIPFGEKRISYSPKAFHGTRHYLYAREVAKDDIKVYRNLALNVYDQHGETNCYPHATANVETRGEAVFAARNAIDGVCENRSHGEWPYQSWGINRQDDAEMTVWFGREVMADKIVLYTRSDFPHDNWWKQVTLTFSDGMSILWDLEKSSLPHILKIQKRKITWVRLSNLIKADDPSPFPALTQIEVYGVVV
jgi:hypothetical protein